MKEDDLRKLYLGLKESDFYNVANSKRSKKNMDHIVKIRY